MIRHLAAALVGLILAGQLASTAYAEKRIALVVGNSAYKNAAFLDNPLSDAALVGDALTADGFFVTVANNLDHAGFLRALRAFQREADGADWAVVYYAGHGLEMAGTNYLIPVDAKLENDRDVPDETITLDRVLSAVEGAKALRLVILDACRNNPFLTAMKRSTPGGRDIGRGLALVAPTQGTLVAYSAAAGTIASDGTGGNSPFAKSLAQHLLEPGVEVRRLFGLITDDVLDATNKRQQPFTYGSLTGRQDFYFRPPEQLGGGATPPGVPVDPVAAAYQAAERIGTVAAWRAFLDAHQREPDSLYFRLASAALQKLDQTALVSRPSPAAGTVERADIATAVTECDRLAARSGDPDNPPGVIGVPIDVLAKNSLAAIAACQIQVDAHPAVRRFGFALGRAYDAAANYDQAKIWYERASAAGSAGAMNNLGRLFSLGRGVARDQALARGWYEKGAEGGNTDAMNNLAGMYALGDGVARDFGKARNWYERAAALGSADAMNNIAALHFNGHGFPQDFGQARNWLEKSANLGNADAINSLGAIYEHAHGVPKDYDKARGWYEKAAALGHGTAMSNLATLYANGHGVVQDYVVARSWLEKGLAAGSGDAMANLGFLYEKGLGVPADSNKARELYERAADSGSALGMNNLGAVYAAGKVVARDYAKARALYEKASDAGNALAMSNLGALYAEGLGVAKDYAKARTLYEKAAAAGVALAMTNLGRLYDAGRGVAKDVVKARSFYEKAAELGEADAMNNLGIMFRLGDGVGKDPAKARSWYEKAVARGSLLAMSGLADLLDRGEGGPRDQERALQLYLRAIAESSDFIFDDLRQRSTLYTVDARMGIQRFLISKGYLQGAADGVFGPATTAALTAYQKSLLNK